MDRWKNGDDGGALTGLDCKSGAMAPSCGDKLKHEWTFSWCSWIFLLYRVVYLILPFSLFPALPQLWRVCHTAGRDAATAGCSRGWEEDPQLPAANGHPAEVGSHAASGRSRVRPRADPPRRPLRPLQGPQQGPRWHLQRLACKSESQLLWPARAQQRRVQRHGGRPHSLLQWEVQDLLRLRSLCKGLLCTDGRGVSGPDPPCISVKEPHFARLAPWPACAPLGSAVWLTSRSRVLA